MTTPKTKTVHALSFVLMIGAAATGAAQDWPQWRGTRRDGIVRPGRSIRWPKTLQPGWTVTVGTGHSSPLVVGDRAYAFAREGDEEVASAIDLRDGRRLWRQRYLARYRVHLAARAHGAGPKSTPIVSGGRLFTLGISGILSSFEIETGRLVWRRDFGGDFRNSTPIYGAAMSPAVDSDILLVHVGGDDDGALAALDVNTGATRWWRRGDGPGYASPIVAEVMGVRQVVLLTQRNLVGVSLAQGQLLWKIPFTTDYDQNAVTPVVNGDTVLYSGLDKGTHAVRIVRRGDAWATEPLWQNTDVSMYLSTPVWAGDRLFGFSHRQKGQFFCLDGRDGRVIWRSEGRQGENATVVSLGEDVLFLTDRGELVAVRRSVDAFTPIATYTVADSPVFAHLVVTREGILVKDETTLRLWRVD